MTFRLVLFVLCAFIGVPSAYGQQLFRVISYNVENLFDTQDNPLADDAEFLPQGQRRWPAPMFPPYRPAAHEAGC